MITAQTTSQTQLPYLESERHFRRYEPYLAQIVKAWPETTVFEPKPPHASVETLSTRIRMARDSLRNSQWPTAIPMAKFLTICDEIVVSTKSVPGCVACGERTTLFKKNREVFPSVLDEKSETQVIPVINLVDPDDELINWVLCGHSRRLLSSPSKIKTKKDLSWATNSYDVGVSQEGEVWTIV